jgi:hypothetical protein
MIDISAIWLYPVEPVVDPFVEPHMFQVSGFHTGVYVDRDVKR